MSKKAILFPGQGAQTVGMGRDLAEAFPECKALYERANQVMGFDLAKVCFEGPIEELTRSSNTQPAIFVTSVACLNALQTLKPESHFDAAAGLSSGEWTALYLAGVVSFEDTLKILQARGQYMQEACELRPGGMLTVIGLGYEALTKVCEGSGVEMANLNSAEQTVLSGGKEGIEIAEKLAKEAGAKMAKRLNVAGAFHSSLMAPAADKLSAFLEQVTFQSSLMPIIANVTAQPHTTPDEIKKLMVKQVTSSVQWVGSIATLKAFGVTSYLECGPGKVLTGLVKRIDNGTALLNIQDRQSLEVAVKA